MSTLNEYLQQVQRFTRDARQDLLNPGDLLSYINRARREVAMRAMCLRVLTPISGAIISASVVAAGSGYTTATVTITAPDYPSGVPPLPQGEQATAGAIIQSGTIAAVDITYGGAGYYQPTASVTGDGSGASVTLEIQSVNELIAGQEVYKFADVNLEAFPGVESVYMILGVSILFANLRYSLPCYDFSTYQAKIRNYAPYQYQYVPAACSQHGQGTEGSFYVYPLPGQAYQYELDCFCLPSDLIDNQSEEALPRPWTEAVPYWAAYLAYGELQNFNTARYYRDEFDLILNRYSTYARPGRSTNPYGRY